MLEGNKALPHSSGIAASVSAAGFLRLYLPPFTAFRPCPKNSVKTIQKEQLDCERSC
jgi:hypothetical protein